MTEDTKMALYEICKKYDDLMIVDVLNYLHRYMWVHREMSVPMGDEMICTGHLYGFTKLMTYLKDKFPNCAIVLALDGIDKSRRSINVEYKAQRDHTYRVDAEMAELLKMCSLVDGVYTCYDENYEADDVINVVSSTVHSLCVKNGIKKNVYILSNDKDMYQIIKDSDVCPVHSILKFGYNGNSHEIVDEACVREKFNGVSPKDLVKYRAIVGDASDNLNGYYRFRKANAAIIAENFDYDEAKGLLYLKEGSKPGLSWKKFLPTIMDNMEIFRNNYAIMKLKSFDFEIVNIHDMESLSESDRIEALSDAMSIIDKYKLNQYKRSVIYGRYSRYRNILSEVSGVE